MSTAPVKVYSLAGAWGLPSASPFCLKLLTWLRMARIPYELRILRSVPKSRTRKAPYIEREDGSLLPDSNFIIQELSQQRQVTLDQPLTAEQRAIAHLVKRTLEKSLYFVAVWNRWRQHWDVTRKGFFAGMPPILRSIVPALVRRDILRQPDGQGVSRNTAEQIYAIGCDDVESVARVLGDGEFFFGRPSTIDAVAYGLFANLLNPPFDDPLTKAMQSHGNLVAFCARMEERYWRE
jgi:glutathione S-transferase